MEDRVALVTGGSRGIGAAIVEELANNNIKIAFTYQKNKEAADSLVKKLNDAGKDILAIQADVGDYDLAKEVVKNVKSHFGRFDILINNAGIHIDKSLLMMTKEDWHNVLDTNLGGTFNYSKAAIFELSKQKSGVIINISSVSGITGIAGQTNYSASKAAIIGFTKALAKELSRVNVRVNAVCPGFIETEMLVTIPENIKIQVLEMIPLKRLGMPIEVARVVSFLVSEKSNYITGQIIPIDGGLT